MSLEEMVVEVIRRTLREELANAVTVSAPGTDPLDHLTPEGVAELLKLTPETVRSLLVARKLPGAKLNGKWRTRRADLEQHMKRLTAANANPAAAPDPDDVGAQLARDIRSPRKAG